MKHLSVSAIAENLLVGDTGACTCNVSLHLRFPALLSREVEVFLATGDRRLRSQADVGGTFPFILDCKQIADCSFQAMGMVFGKISVETPKYTVVAKEPDFEVREYEPWLIAETSYNPSQEKEGEAFMVLANYIGALGKARNVKPSLDKGEEAEKIAMTAPVITFEKKGESGEGEPEKLEESKRESQSGEKIAVTAPVVTAETPAGLTSMQFVLPSKYSSDNVPKPIDERVAIREIPGRKFGVIKFSGVANQELVDKKRERLRVALEDAGYTITGDYILARYNPPFTLSFLRTNEVLLPVA